MRKLLILLATIFALVFTSAGQASAATARGSVSAKGGAAAASRVTARPNVANAAAAVGFRIFNATCSATAIRFSADTFENGRSGVQQFRQRAQLQEFTGGRWVPATQIVSVKSAKFPNDTRSFHFVRQWTANHANNGHSWRVAWQGFYLNGFGGVIARTKVIYVNCF